VIKKEDRKDTQQGSKNKNVLMWQEGDNVFPAITGEK
jgi:hypothetical protein